MTDHHYAIEKLLYLYAKHIDAGDFEELAALFTHATISSDYSPEGVSGYDAVLNLYQRSTRIYDDNHTPHTQHVISNIIIDIDDNKATASSHARFTVFQAVEDFPLQAIIAGHYRDQFIYTEGRWRFQHRYMAPELLGDLSHHLLFDLAK